MRILIALAIALLMGCGGGEPNERDTDLATPEVVGLELEAAACKVHSAGLSPVNSDGEALVEQRDPCTLSRVGRNTSAPDNPIVEQVPSAGQATEPGARVVLTTRCENLAPLGRCL